jgi:hypothetical protein
MVASQTPLPLEIYPTFIYQLNQRNEVCVLGGCTHNICIDV